MALQIRRGTTVERNTVVFKEGEIVFDTTLKEVYIGDNTTLGGLPVTAYTDEKAVDAVGAALLAGTHSNISFAYGSTQDGANRIDATVTLDGGLLNVVDDTSPQLGGNLDLNTRNITGTGDINITGTVTATTYGNLTAATLGLGNVTNESKATMFTDPVFTGTVTGVSATTLGLGNVTNESKATMFTDPVFTGTTEIDVLSVSGLASFNVAPVDAVSINIIDSTTPGSSAPGLILNLQAGSLNSGTGIDFKVNTTGLDTVTIGTLSSAYTDGVQSMAIKVYNTITGLPVTQIDTIEGTVFFNDYTTSITNNGVFTFDPATRIVPTITASSDLTLYPDGNIVTYGNVIPGLEGVDQGTGDPVAIASGTFDLGATAQRYKDLYLTQSIVIGGFTPASSKGATGHVAGQVTMDDNYIYRCVATYTDGIADIWKRTALDATPW